MNRAPEPGIARFPAENRNNARILVIRLDEIGDVLMTVPMLRRLRFGMPNAWISLLVKPAVASLVEQCPYVNEVVTYDWQTPRLLRSALRQLRAWELARRQLLPRKFDVALLPRWDVDYYHAGYVALLCGARDRIAYSEHVSLLKERFNRGYDAFFTQVLFDQTPKHEVERGLDIAGLLGCPPVNSRLEIWFDEADKAKADSALLAVGINQKDRVIAIAPGKHDPSRRWPADWFRQIASWLHRTQVGRVLVIGGKEEAALGEEVLRDLQTTAANLAGKLTLRQTAALLSRCSLYVGNDTGPKHIAAACTLPVIEINAFPKNGDPFHQHASARFHAWQVRQHILQPDHLLAGCNGCCRQPQAHCILQVSVENVQAAIAKELAIGDALAKASDKPVASVVASVEGG